MPVTINGSNTPTAGGVTYGDGTQYATTSAGTSGQLLQSNGASAPSWVAAPTTSPAGSNTQIQYNNSGAFGASSNLTYDGTKVSILSSAATTLESVKSTSTTSQGALVQFLNDTDTPLNFGVWGSSAGSFGTLGASTPFVSTNASTLNLVNTNASGSIVFGTGSSATERFRIASAGQLGIGGANYGTSGQVLTSAGSGAAPTWSTPSSGSYVLLATVNASASSTVDLTGFVDNTTYQAYEVVIGPTTASTDALLYMRVRKSGSYLTTDYSIDSNRITNSAATDIRLSGGNVRGTPWLLTYQIRIWDDEAYRVSMTLLGGYSSPSTFGQQVAIYGSASSLSGSTGAMDGVQFYLSSGTLTGQFRVYGIKK